MWKKRVEQALENYAEKQLKKPSGKSNSKPEKAVEKTVMQWCTSKGWQMSVVESKAVFSSKAGRYLGGQAPTGFSDLVGSTDQGLFAAIELKAPGRLSTLRLAQYEYLKKVIASRGFGAVVDSVARLENVYQSYLEKPLDQRPDYLLSLLPLPKELRVTSIDWD